MQEMTQARIGMVDFINTAPLYEIWQQTVNRPEWRVVEAPPSDLCRMLYENELDFGLVSSHEYAVHPDRYRILGDLSISASGPVGSVFLFSETPPEELAGRLVLLSYLSQTSASLVKIVLEDFYRVRPRYESGDILASRSGLEKASAVMAIGDNALRLLSEGRYAYRLDLGEVWCQRTGLPFVFAVWAVREEFFAREPGCVAEVHAELLRCQAAGRENLSEISRKVAPRIPMPPEACYDYLRAMHYDLGPEKREALKRFFEYLIQRGEGNAGSLPLKIIEPDIVE